MRVLKQIGALGSRVLGFRVSGGVVFVRSRVEGFGSVGCGVQFLGFAGRFAVRRWVVL